MDRIFIGRGVGALAIAGLVITMPIMNVIHAFGALIGVGSASRMSIVLGKKDKEWAEKILCNSLIFTVLIGVVVITVSYIFLDRILMMFGATPETVAYAHEYMIYILPGMFLITVTFNLTGLIRASGYPTKAMLIMAGGAILNIILDPIFIFALHLGIKGAAIASTLSIAVMAVIAIMHFIDKKSFIRFKANAWKPKGYIFKNITMIGMSPFLMNLAAAGVVAILNNQLLRYGGDLAVGAYGICNTYGNFLVLVIIGVCQGMQPIAGYNYGAGHGHRLRHVYTLTMKVCVSVGLFGSVVSCIFPGAMMSLFTKDIQLIEIGRTALRYSMVMFPLIGFTIVNSNFFQSVDKPWIAITTSLSRQVIFLVPMSILIPIIYEKAGLLALNGVWISLTISDVLGAVLATMLLITQRNIFLMRDTDNVE